MGKTEGSYDMRYRYREYLVVMAVSLATVLGAFQNSADLLTQARAAIKAGDLAAAEVHLKSAVDADDANAEVHFELSRLLLDRDNLKGTQTHLKKAIELDGRNQDYRDFAEKVSVISSAMSQASRTFDEQEYEKAAGEYEGIITKYPRFASAYYGLGLSLMKASMLKGAADAFRNAAELNPEDQRYSMALRKLVADQYNEGNRRYNTRDWEAAIESYVSAIDLDPTFVQAYYRQARCERNLGDPEAALETLDRALAVRPDYVTAIIEKGNILRSQSRGPEAEETYRMAIAFDATSSDAYVGLGAVLRTDQRDEAIRTFEMAISLNPKNSTAHEYLGEIYSDQENWKKALDHLSTASKLKPKDYRTHWRLSVAYNATDKSEDARQSARKSVNLKKTFEYGWYELGIAEKALGNRQAAIEAFKNAEKGRDGAIRKTARYELQQLDASSQ